MEMTTPQRVDVERLSELLAKATPGRLETVQNTNVCWEIRYPNWRRNHFVHDGDMAALIVAAVNALPALLQQLADLQEACTELTKREAAQFSDAAAWKATARAMNAGREAAESKLAERDAEVSMLRNGAEQEKLNLLTQLHAAERAREEAERDALLMARWISNLRLEPWQEVDHACEQCRPGGEIVKAGFICGRHTAAAFLAANGGACED